jgi:transcriptional regulator with XRE-family HTH domain
MRATRAIDERPAADSLEATVARRLREIRKKSGATLADIAKLAKTTPQTIQRLETAHMALNIGWMAKICAALRISPEILFTEDLHRFEETLAGIMDGTSSETHDASADGAASCEEPARSGAVPATADET